VVVLQAVLGLTVDVPGGPLTLRPARPSPVGALQVRRLRVGDGHLDVDIARDGTVEFVDATGSMRVDVAGR